MVTYIFGYGSLIDRDSRTRTNPAAVAARPVIVEGIQRGWWVHGAPIGFSTCFLSAKEQADAICNGVLYPVTPAELEALDKRESIYTRTRIESDKIRLLDGMNSLEDGAKVWFYAQDSELQLPDATFPIVQSYVDICLNGCLEIEALYPLAKEANFAELFIKSTADWSHYWVNDRLYPRRPFIYVPKAFQIDTLLYNLIPEQFNFIQLQPAHWD